MPSQERLEFYAPGMGLSLRARLLREDNPDVVEEVLSQLPLKSVLGHVVISGEAIWIPTRIVHLGQNNMVQRHPGAVYLYAPGQTICLTYGKITESANVNKFAEVFEEDLPILKQLGGLVYEQTVAQPRRNIVEINIRRAA
ncbi:MULTISPECIES: DUF3830 family protein [Sinorhizobium]|uniref:DUF3830 family protein n=1 Tax=Sinorhizobium TaxID=28105 RepID=UPI000FDC5365|nr:MULTISPECIES: DUF3830 family protein [Sinorhizobium]MBO1965235.1 DUF3830 family protein [Sinorhizobium medicae]MDW9359046.1 DUF3830 family protein [Sinorhizobium meliloti]MDW9418523.1 DUF3830 family protein [Sinorhizobium meliloti]MDW9464266.1 DUF3830 family protein [Sinorhizobium meliloti]MDW9514614.1 DUF3830 family protein [Sinorhizobium meliloti]